MQLRFDQQHGHGIRAGPCALMPVHSRNNASAMPRKVLPGRIATRPPAQPCVPPPMTFPVSNVFPPHPPTSQVRFTGKAATLTSRGLSVGRSTLLCEP